MLVMDKNYLCENDGMINMQLCIVKFDVISFSDKEVLAIRNQHTLSACALEQYVRLCRQGQITEVSRPGPYAGF